MTRECSRRCIQRAPMGDMTSPSRVLGGGNMAELALRRELRMDVVRVTVVSVAYGPCERGTSRRVVWPDSKALTDGREKG